VVAAVLERPLGAVAGSDERFEVRDPGLGELRESEPRGLGQFAALGFG
jgi:hypothetical protein